MSELRYDTVETSETFAALAREGWDDLVRAQPRPSPFLLHCWLDAWWEHYAPGRLAVQVARRGERLVGALPVYVERRAAGVRVTRFVGGDHAELADVILAAGEPDETAAALLERAARGADVCDFFGLPTASRAERCAGGRLAVHTRAEAPVLDLHDGFDATYERKFSSKRRYEHRRKRKKLAELGELSVGVARSAGEVAAVLEDAFALHAKRWQGLPDGSGFVTPRGKEFHRDGYRRLAEADVLRIVTLLLDGRPIAFHAYASLCGALYSDRMAYDLELARFSPGFLNTLDMLEEAGREGLTRIEFLGGDEDYKLQLADRFDPLCQGFGLASTARGRVYARGRAAALALRLALKRSESVRRLYYGGLAPLRRLRMSVASSPGGR